MGQPYNSSEKAGVYLICDMDGTLLVNDHFKERLIRMSFYKPLKVLQATLKGLVYLKHYIMEGYKPDVNDKINREVLDFIKRHKDRYTSVLLISATSHEFVTYVAAQIGVFDAAYGTKHQNLKGASKLQFIRENGFVPFEYIGDSKADKVIFDAAEKYYRVSNNRLIVNE